MTRQPIANKFFREQTEFPMDQLKTQLAVVAKHGFWIASVIVLLGSLYMWYATTSTLAKEADAQTRKVETAFSTVTSVRGEVPTTPNEHSHAKMQELIDARTLDVLKSWKTLYDRQRGILTWPVEALKQDFVDEYKDLIPIERYVKFPTAEEDELESTLLSRYQTYIRNTLPGIAEIGKTKWVASFDSSSGGGGDMMDMDMMGMGGDTRSKKVSIRGVEEGPLVKWSSTSQGQVLEDLFPWRGRRPNTLEVYYSQENIWILKQLLQIVADVNGKAEQAYQAKIHEIRQIGIGRSVKFNAGNISAPGIAAMGMGRGMDMDMDMGMDMDMDMGGGMDMGMMSMSDPADNRYVDVSMNHIQGSTLRSALESNSPNDASLAVAKRVPVMMSVNIDQRSVHEFIAQCGSADLMVEVKHVRVLPQSSGAIDMDGSGGGDMGMEMDMDMGGDMGMDMGMGGGLSAPPQASNKNTSEFPLDVNVEMYGIIYIYNPPDRAKFGLEEVTADTVVAGSTETVGGEPVAPSTQGELPVPTPNVPAATPPAADAPAQDPPATTPPAGDPPATPPAADPGPATGPTTDSAATSPPAADPAAAAPAPPAGTPPADAPGAAAPAAAPGDAAASPEPANP